MTTNTLTTPAAVREHADTMELRQINFLDKHGNIGARAEQMRSVHLIFVDGVEARLSVKKFNMLADVQFKLRPSVDQ